jgi:hypothetical protein
MSSESSLDNVVKPQQENAEPSPLAVRLDPRVGAEACSDATTEGGSDPCSGSGGKGDKGVV